MKLSELKSMLRANPEALPRFTLPDGDQIPLHYHITEVGHITKRFIDCGGKLHDRSDTCLLQTHVGRDVEHRLRADRFAKILELGGKILPDEEMDVEVEYDCCVVSHYPIAVVEPKGAQLEFKLGKKRTACLARERENEGEPASACC